uniref:G-protein coupled receptors family 1 profile domain-containing protein n=1 Tax=Phocoena sinus TaxID=42100 RepID=A0A8C9C5W3_PHOSS
MGNQSVFSEFILLGFSVDPQPDSALHVVSDDLLLTLLGNLVMLLVIRVDPHLHTPMSFFLGQLSFLDLCHSSVTVPKMLENLLSESKTIFVESCLAQTFFVFATRGTEACLLAVMAYDRCVAISSPLLCGQVMDNQLCIGLVWGSWDYREDQTLPHFSCELSSLFHLSCSDTSTNFTLLLCSSVVRFFGTFILIFFSYICIVSAILSISSTAGRSKAFSTCSSHLTAVILFYGSGFLSYLLANLWFPLEMIFPLQYSVITPMKFFNKQNNNSKLLIKTLILSVLHI